MAAPLDLGGALALYERHGDDLRRVREEQREMYRASGYSALQPVPPYRWLRRAARTVGLDWERGAG